MKSRAFISELDGKQCVVVRAEGEGRPQVYVCIDLVHAQKWLQLMAMPERLKRVPPTGLTSPLEA